MGRVLSANVWVEGVFYGEGTSEAAVGNAAGQIGDHAWRDDAPGKAAPEAPVEKPAESSFVVEEQGPSRFAAAPASPAEDEAPEDEAPEPEPEPGKAQAKAPRQRRTSGK
jgi:hypothetical protein